MQRYGRYKPSGVEWLGEIPESWNVCRNIGLFDERKEINRPEMELLSVTINRGVIKQEEITEKKDSSNEDKSKYKVVRKDDLAYNKMRMWQGAIGRSAYDGIVSPAYVILSPRDKLYSRYYHYLYRTETFIGEANRHSYGLCLDMNSLRYEDFKTIYSPVPPRSGVERIVAFLDQKTAEIDAAIAKKERLIELLQEQKRIEVNRAITKGLNASSPMVVSEYEWLEKIPAHWRIVPLLSVADVIDPNPSHRNPKYTEIGFPFVSTVEFEGDDDILLESTRRVTESTVLEQERRCHFGKASIGFSRKGTIGAVRRLPVGPRFALLDSLCVINVKEGADVQFIYRQLGADIISGQYGPVVRGAALKQLSVGRVRALKVLLPPRWEQEQIAQHIDGRLSEINGVIGRVRIQLDQLAELRDMLISYAVTGQLKI